MVFGMYMGQILEELVSQYSEIYCNIYCLPMTMLFLLSTQTAMNWVDVK